MKSQVIAREVRWRPVVAGVPADWSYVRLLPNQAFSLPDAVRGTTYQIQARNLGIRGTSSPWVAAPAHTVAATIREGTLALPVNSIANLSSVWNVDTSVTYNATDSSATVSVSAGTLVIGGETVAYGASSAVVPGAPSTTKTVYLYYDDPTLSGGSLTLGVTEDFITSMAGNGRIAITTLLINFPAAGGTSTGGGGIGGGGGGGGTKNPGVSEQPV